MRRRPSHPGRALGRDAPALHPRPLVGLALLALAAGLGACRDVGSYSTKPGESYCGSIVQGSFVRSGFAADARLRLRLDADALESKPGTIATSDGAFHDAALLPLPEFFNDPLATLQFGDGRRRNLIYGIDPSEGPTGSTTFAVVSLMDSGDVEVRLVRGAPGASLPAGVARLFGVFPLARQTGACGF